MYENNDIQRLELLRFNLKGRKWLIQRSDIGDYFYLMNRVDCQKITYLRMLDKNNKALNLGMIDNVFYNSEPQIQICWEELANYKALGK